MVRGFNSSFCKAMSLLSDNIFYILSCHNASDNFIDDLLGFELAYFTFAVIPSTIQIIRYFAL